MALTKVKGSGGEGITNLSNATFLSVDASEVATLLTTAVINSEGAAVTTNIAQGLAKAWIDLDGTGTISISDSLNIGGVTDNNTGDFTLAYTNNMSSANYCCQSSCGGAGQVIISNRGGVTDSATYMTSSTHRLGVRLPHTDAWVDNDLNCVANIGDLA